MNMAVKRYIATDLPQQAWYMELEPRLKSLWVHLLLTCDIAGTFEITPRVMSAFIGEPITEDDIFTAFGNRVIRWRDKGLIPNFVSIQYYSAQRQRLTPSCKQHAYVLARLKDLGLTEDKLDEMGDRDPQMKLPIDCPKPTKEKPQRCIIPPKLEWVQAYCEERKNGIDANRFMDWYEARGWRIGDRVMLDWQAAVRTWENGDRKRGRASTGLPNILNDPNYSRKRKF